MTKEEMAARLTGREYGDEITPEEERIAKAYGLVVVFGYSDDIAELRGAINDEVPGTSPDPFVIVDGALFDDSDDCDCKHAEAARERAESVGHDVLPVFGAEGQPDWTFKTEIPHATFDVMEGAEVFCRGIVFNLPANRVPAA